MSKEIQCPVCLTNFNAEPDSKGMCSCPNCKSILMITSGMPNYDFVVSFEECVLEALKVTCEAKNLDDASLEDEIGEAMAVHDFMEGSFSIFTDMDVFKKMTETSRSLAEGVYILIHTNTYFGYEQ